MIRALIFATTFACALIIAPIAGHAEMIFGLTNLQQLVSFDSSARTVTATTNLVGFSVSGEIIQSIDYRPATGQLYGLSSLNNLYVINTTTGISTQVGPTLSPAPTGFVRAIDFNPTVDRIRVVDSAGTNLRVNPNDGSVTTDGSLAYVAGDRNAGTAPAVVNVAYTNSFAGATTTTLYDIDSATDSLVTQTPANNGTLSTVGSLGFDIVASGGFTGFDISGQTGVAYLVGNKIGATNGLTAGSLYTVNLATGAASLTGSISGLNGLLRDIAVAPAAVPEPSSLALCGVASLAGLGTWFRRRRAGGKG